VTGLELDQGAGPDDHTVDGRPQAGARQPQGPQVQGVPAVSAAVDPAPFRGVCGNRRLTRSTRSSDALAPIDHGTPEMAASSFSASTTP
jgi:hypothetical protein